MESNQPVPAPPTQLQWIWACAHKKPISFLLVTTPAASLLAITPHNFTSPTPPCLQGSGVHEVNFVLFRLLICTQISLYRPDSIIPSKDKFCLEQVVNMSEDKENVSHRSHSEDMVMDLPSDPDAHLNDVQKKEIVSYTRRCLLKDFTEIVLL